jgi:hypothetical protein
MAYIGRIPMGAFRRSGNSGYMGTGSGGDDGDDNDFKYIFWSLFSILAAFVIAFICAYS